MSNVDKLRSAHQAFNRRDWTAVVQNFVADTEYSDQARGVTLKGPQQFADYLRATWVAPFSDAAVTEASYLDAGSQVTAQYTITGTNDGPFGPMPRTGRRISVPFCEIMWFNEPGQVVSSVLYYDQVSILVQLGHMEVPPVT